METWIGNERRSIAISTRKTERNLGGSVKQNETWEVKMWNIRGIKEGCMVGSEVEERVQKMEKRQELKRQMKRKRNSP